MGVMMGALDSKLAQDKAALQNKETQLNTVRHCESAHAHRHTSLLNGLLSLCQNVIAAERMINHGLGEAEKAKKTEAALQQQIKSLEARLEAANQVHTPDNAAAAAMPPPTLQTAALSAPTPASLQAVPVAAPPPPPPPPPPPLPVVAVPAASLPPPPDRIVENIFSYAGGAPPIEERDAAYKELLAEYTAGTAPSPSPPAYGPPSPEELKSRQDAIRGAIRHTWTGYKAHAWGQDNLNPVSGRGSSGGFGHAVTMVDSLDTLWIAGMKDEFKEAADWCAANLPGRFSSLTGGLSAFETTIRSLGAVVSSVFTIPEGFGI